MTAPTPADVYGTRPVVRFFGPVAPGLTEPSARRARARNDALRAVEQLAKALSALMTADERDLDLNLERYRRAADRADAAIDAFDTALADGPPGPEPRRL
ncbi:hypothetical protein [Cellulomonas sp. HZM]|uniref:hypothetical protein n=1 Tax=Cellulomonas sp. HZM TaxID=1454010 RepID=UPI0004934179|nr:hypothetical protein [Cellulomonas sp. HZM]